MAKRLGLCWAGQEVKPPWAGQAASTRVESSWCNEGLNLVYGPWCKRGGLGASKNLVWKVLDASKEPMAVRLGLVEVHINPRSHCHWGKILFQTLTKTVP